MKFKPVKLAVVCSLALIVGCAKTDSQSNENTPATQPTATANPATQPVAEADSVLMIDRVAVWFPPARLRITTSDGKVVARLYSDDPKDVLTGKETVNSYDIRMVLPDISDPADIASATWINHSASMERQDTPFGIFLNNQQDILQPMNVTVRFVGQAPKVKVLLQGTFSRFHISDQTNAPAPSIVNVMGFLDATVRER